MNIQHRVQVRDSKIVVTGGFTQVGLFSAECLGFKTGPEVVIDPMRTAYTALSAFAKHYSPELASAIKGDEISALYRSKFDRGHAYIRQHVPFWETLNDYQMNDLVEMAGRRSNILAHDMGMGKTVTAIATSIMFRASKTLVVCPAGAKWNWFKELKKWGVSELAISVMDTKKSIKAMERDGMYAIINFDILGRGKFADAILNTEWDHVIVDEAHLIKNVRSKRTAAVRAVLYRNPKARLTLMTGTPIKNRVNDLFSYLGLCKHPLGRRQEEFENRYCVKQFGQIKGSKNEPELHVRLANLLVRRRSEGHLDLPEMNKHMLKIPFDVHMKEYEEVVQEVLQDNLEYVELGEKIKNLRDKGDPQYREQIKQYQNQRRKKKVRLRGHIGVMNKLTAQSKVNKAISLAESLIAKGEKVVIFCGYTDPIVKLHAYFGRRSVVIRGNVSTHDRMKREWLFRNTDEVQVFIGNMQAAGVGINLVEAAHTIFLSFPMTPDEIRQAEKRVHRQGQTRDVHNYYIVCEGSIDEHVMRIIDPKQDQADRILDGKPVYKQYQDIEGKVLGSFLKSLSSQAA